MSVVCVADLLVLTSQRDGLAQDKPLKKINWGVTSLSGGNWIPWIAKEAKIYEKHGLDVQLILLARFRSDFGGAPRRQHFRFAGGAADGHARGFERCRPC